MEPVRYFIPTRGRVGRQATVSNLPPAVRRVLTIVCPKEEADEHRKNHPDVCVLEQPDYIKSIGEKRQWILMVAAAGVEFAWMMDDDLKFKYLYDGRFVSARPRSGTLDFPEYFESVFSDNIPALYQGTAENDYADAYPVVGIGTSYFAPKGGIKENYHLGFAFGFNREVRKALKLGRLDVFEDIDYTLQCLRGGYRIAVTYDITVDQIKATISDDPADGGVAGERTIRTIDENLERLISYHPGLVARKELRPGAHPAAITRVRWAAAAKEGGLEIRLWKI